MARRHRNPKRRRPKDPRRPKRPMNSFFYFYKDNREAAANSPMMKTYMQAMTAKVAGKMWKKADPDAKNRAVQEFGQSREQYRRAAKQYRPPTKEQWQHIMTHWPKRALSNYNFFVREKFRQIWNGTHGAKSKREKFGAVSRMVARRWSRLTGEEKEKYDRLSGQDRARRKKEIEDLWATLH